MHPKRKLPPGASWQRRVIPILLAAALSSCSVSRKPEEPPEREVKSSGLTMAELDQLARNYSDRLVIRVSSVCDQIKQEVRDDKEAFAKAHELKLTVALAA
ncbi:MAG TPA: hypothetical protein VKU80_10045 [Planctomycetota bacterium]|nr:hypothetical protein [Planctomycetota bacterium]